MIVIDQTVGASVALSMFMFTRSLIDGKSIDQIKERFRNDWVNTWITGLHVWGPTQAVNFYFVPLQLRVVRRTNHIHVI
jgi:protein Mpv17